MSSKVVIQVKSLSKHYRLGSIGGATLREDLGRWWARVSGKPDPWTKIDQISALPSPNSGFWALQDVSFEVREGEVLGVIGRNGAGKSTLLKILSRITAPTSGRALIRGKVGSLLEVGTGFHPELTGRENVYLNGAILGMTRREITEKMGEIVEFAEMAKFIDTPVKRYSSGMTVRLAFAVAAHLEPEILIVDEVLAVGDANFQQKCIGKMKEVSSRGRTVVFVSHNIDAIRRICTRSILMAEGRLLADGSVSHVSSLYTTSRAHVRDKSDLLQTNERSGNGKVRVRKVEVRETTSMECADVLESGGAYTFVIECVSRESDGASRSTVTLEIADERGTTVLLVSSTSEGVELNLPKPTHVHCSIDSLNLASGDYTLTVYLGTLAGETYDLLKDVLRITVAGGDYFGTGHGGFPDFCKTLTRSRWVINNGAS